MSTTSHKKTYDWAALAVLAIVFVALTIVAGFLLRGMRLDLTQNKLYSIAPGTQRILASVDEPIHLYYFFSQDATSSVPSIRAYAQRVRELLEEMSQRSKGKIKLTVIDPQPFSEDEDRAAELGLTAVPLGANGTGGGTSLYFGLAGTNSTDGHETIPLFQPEKEEFLEYDVASLIHRLAHPKKPVVGLMSTLPVDAAFDPQTGQMRQGWAALSQVRELYDVRTLASDMTSIDKDVDVLLLIHPKDLPPQALYAIDQFVLRGGKLLAFVDPLSMQDNAMGPMGAMGGGAGQGSDLGPLLPAWGIDYDRGKVLADAKLALAVATRRGQPPSRHLGIFGLGRDQMNSKDVVTATLDSLNFMTAGALSARKGATATFEPLLHSSGSAALLGSERFAMLEDPQTLLDGFKPTGQVYTIAARVHGKLSTAFPGGAPASAVPKPQDTPGKPPAPAAAQLKTSQGDANIIVVADTDFLADMLWVRSQNVFGQPVAIAWANNGDFLNNALDNLAGSSDLISVRGRQSFFRPFDRVDELRRQADEHLRVKEQELNRELQETERKLSELQSGRNDKNALVLSPEQQAELTRFQEQRVSIRKDLRDVRRNLQVNIDRLGTTLKILNIAAVPVLIAIAALLLAAARRRRLKRGREAVAQGAMT